MTTKTTLKRIELREDGLARVLEEETLPAQWINRVAKPEDTISVKNRILAVKPVSGDNGQYLATKTYPFNYSKPGTSPSRDCPNIRRVVQDHVLKEGSSLPEELYFTLGVPTCTGSSPEKGWSDYSFPVQFYVEVRRKTGRDLR